MKKRFIQIKTIAKVIILNIGYYLGIIKYKSALLPRKHWWNKGMPIIFYKSK